MRLIFSVGIAVCLAWSARADQVTHVSEWGGSECSYVQLDSGGSYWYSVSPADKRLWSFLQKKHDSFLFLPGSQLASVTVATGNVDPVCGTTGIENAAD